MSQGGDTMTKDFSSLDGIDLEVYAGVDNIIHIDVSDDDGNGFS